MKIFSGAKRIIQVYVVRTLVEKVPVLKTVFTWLDGKKTTIGRAGVLISLVLAALQYSFPEIPHITEINTYTMMIMAWLFEQLGIQHAEDKYKREELFRQEFGAEPESMDDLKKVEKLANKLDIKDIKPQ